MALTTVDAGLLSSQSQQTWRNRIINSQMQIDQRNAGASVTPTDGAYDVDRWSMRLSQASKYTSQQSSTAPTGFTKSLLVTSSSAYSVGSGDYFAIEQWIEGYNTADLGWGASGAQTVTLSFWVRSSLTGTFGGSLRTYAGGYSYPFSYTISSANTWEQKTVTITGATAGTWNTTNSGSIGVAFSLGAGSSYSGTANAWAASTYFQPTGATSVVGTNGATFYITGVQLEKGSTATSFDYRPYGTELALCQRYCYSIFANEGGDNYTRYGIGDITTTLNGQAYMYFPVNMRVTPSITTTATASDYAVYSAGGIAACSAVPSMQGASSKKIGIVNGTVASGGVVGRAFQLISNNNTTSYLIFSAEL
jgi:hypothetical protein